MLKLIKYAIPLVYCFLTYNISLYAADPVKKASRYIYSGQYVEAKAFINKALVKQPNNFGLYYLMAEYYYRDDNPAQNIDSAHVFSTLTEHKWLLQEDEKAKSKYAKLGNRFKFRWLYLWICRMGCK